MVERIGDVLSWANDIDEKTLEQAESIPKLPFVHKPLALMPDAHFGFGATVGSVIATRGAVIPSAVGVDIGCGMIASKTGATSQTLGDNLEEWHHRICQVVPTGVGGARNKNDAHEDPVIKPKWAFHADIDLDKLTKQAGTLGSGNHFIELTLDEDDNVWLVLHSGSRGTGYIVANHHISNAKNLMKKYFIEIDNPELAYFVEGTPEFDAYISDMLSAQEYAMDNRQIMLDSIYQAIPELGEAQHVVNCHHNYCEQESHYKKNMWVTRKGAIRARKGDYGVIPGSMSTGSYIVKGLGNQSSYTSASHGAGRKMSRTQARKQIDSETFEDKMQGIVWNKQPDELLDEHPDAYKDFNEVMESQKDLVEIVHTLKPILNVKGN